MERSDEVAEALSSLMGTFGTDAMGTAFDRAVSSEPGTLLIGTDPAEWWSDQEALRRVIKTQAEELRGAVVTVTHAEGWAQGSVGWGALRADVEFGGGPSTTLRVTATLVDGDDGWKIVQGHVSVGAANEEVVGQELTI